MSSVPPVSQPPADLAERPAREPIFRIPALTGWLILANLVVHVLRQFLPSDVDSVLVETFGYAPAKLFQPIGLTTLASLISYQFLHAGWDHLGMNMVTLLAFGAGVEKAFGRVRFFILYLVAGIAGALLESAVGGANGNDVLIGASGSISGAFGALMIILGFHRRGRTPVRVLSMVLLWSSVLAATGILGIGANGSPVAWIDHIGGFIAGIALGLLFEQFGGAPDRRFRRP